MAGEPQNTQTDLVFAALAHAARRRILDLLVMAPGMTVKAVASHFTISRIAVMKHLAALEQANLIISEKEGRERRLYFNPVPIQQIYDRWTDQYSAFWAGRLVDIQARVQEAAAEKGAKRA
ncbi:MAG TPA: helix-turn-helix transcriptional regulator [Phycisphaerales bacterium]|nr:helix-turn-helix transcriptional regulator [Phycisphaerales bacterium]